VDGFGCQVAQGEFVGGGAGRGAGGQCRHGEGAREFLGAVGQDQGEVGGQPGRQVRGSDRTGVTDDTITLGLHAPVTGAAPLPSRSFEESGDLWWRWVTEEQGRDILGRDTVELLFRDDRYDPSSAIQVCRELAQRAFALAGGGGTDQIQACGRFANQARVPYFSAGVTEAGLRGLDWYFATSMSYKQQGGLLGQYVSRNFSGHRAAAVITDTENFDDAVQGWEESVQRHGIPYYRTLRHPRGDTGWYRSFAAELRDNDVDVVYVLTAPVDYIRFAQQAHEIGYEPQWVGVGISMGLNAVLGAGCPDVDRGTFFSPFPGLDWARDNVPEFFETADHFGAPVDDIAFAIWGASNTTHELFEAYGEVYGDDLTREDFRDFVEHAEVRTGIFPDIRYTPDDHFGANQVHVIQADSSEEEYVTLHTFATGF
jgi:ABC-type branched-subunit amino acid transport system substrate-binding protein